MSDLESITRLDLFYILGHPHGYISCGGSKGVQGPLAHFTNAFLKPMSTRAHTSVHPDPQVW